MKKSLMIFIPLLLTVALACALVWAVIATNRADKSELILSNNAKSIYQQIHDNLNDIDTNLKKCGVATTNERQIMLFADVWRLANETTTALSQISASHADDYGLQQFIVRVGDYCHSLMEQLLNGTELSDTDRKQLESLQKKCNELATEVRTNIENEEYPTIGGDENFYEGTKDESEITDYPRLIYDGPFSESNENMASYLEGEDIDEAAAQAIAQQWFPDKELTSNGLCKGKSIESWDFQGENLDVSITKKGGQMLYFMSQPTGDKSDPPSNDETDRLHAAAEKFLQEKGYNNMKPSYAQYYNGAVVLNYAATQDGVILYSDLIKVYVDRDTQQVIGIDARSYVFSHRERKLDTPALTKDDAAKKVTQKMTVNSVELALIPKTAQTEVLCYEFKGTQHNTFFIVYINAQTGSEEQIFEVINSEEGDLVV
ncbi:MAG: germination protein YpeB [Eubacteriales bacterium]|nr:germination protein YpeB [Eubacteriales bacterium]